jgi:hypothetical protein
MSQQNFIKKKNILTLHRSILSSSPSGQSFILLQTQSGKIHFPESHLNWFVEHDRFWKLKFFQWWLLNLKFF